LKVLTSLSQIKNQSNGDNITLAISAVLCAVLALSLGDALIKFFSARFTLAQIFVVRSIIALPILIAIIKIRYRSVALRPNQFGWTVLRSAMLAIMWLAYYFALPHVAFSIAAASFYTLPLFITLFAGLFLGEKVGALGWLAVCIGFGGVLLILRPEAGDFNAYALLPLISAVLYAFAMILTRSKCKTEHPLVLAVNMNAAMLGLGLAISLVAWIWGPSGTLAETYSFLFGPWAAMGVEQLLVMASMAAAIIVGGIGAAVAYQSGPSSTVATYDFLYLAFVTIWGILFFGEVPDASTVVGMALIVSAGVMAVRR
jgi:drug/metabolite transporter (DMT)-like permease